MRALRFVLPVAAILVTLAGCSDMGDPTQTVAPPPGGVSYANDVEPIFVARGCKNPGCHGGPSATEVTGMLSSYSHFVNRESFSYAPAVIVVPGDADASVLYNKIQDTGLYGQSMPFGLPLIPQAERDLIRDWILEGAQNN